MNIYLAGPMAKVAERGAVARWRQMVIAACTGTYGVNLLCPEVVGCDHTGINARETAKGDLALLDDADAVLAYLDSHDRVGTCVEIGYAVGARKTVLVVVDKWLHDKPHRETNHVCDCCMGNEGFGWPWFVEAAAAGWTVLPGECIGSDEIRFWKNAVDLLVDMAAGST